MPRPKKTLRKHKYTPHAMFWDNKSDEEVYRLKLFQLYTEIYDWNHFNRILKYTRWSVKMRTTEKKV